MPASALLLPWLLMATGAGSEPPPRPSALRVVVDAGPDVEVVYPAEVNLQGAVSGLSPVGFWLADGNAETENCIVTYHEQDGTGVIGPLSNGRGTIYGWPSDLIRIRGTVYGIETQQRRLYTLDESTAICKPVGPRQALEWLTCMAYDEERDRLYALDGRKNQLFLVDRRTGTFQPIGKPLRFDEIKGLAYHPRSALLYAYDQRTNTLLTIDPARNAQAKRVRVLELPRGAYVDELDFHEGELYGVILWEVGEREAGQVVHVDLYTGELTKLGPEFPDVSAHTLMVTSMPERVEWSKVDGPGRVRFLQPTSPISRVRISQPGTYILKLEVRGPLARGVDTVRVVVRPAR